MITVQRKFSHGAPKSFYEILMQDTDFYHCAKFYQDIIRFVAARGRQSWDSML